MLLRHADAFGAHRIRVGDVQRMPERLPGPFTPIGEFSKHGLFRVTAFPVCGSAAQTFPCNRAVAHCITIERLCDGWTTTIAAHYWTRVAEEQPQFLDCSFFRFKSQQRRSRRTRA